MPIYSEFEKIRRRFRRYLKTMDSPESRLENRLKKMPPSISVTRSAYITSVDVDRIILPGAWKAWTSSSSATYTGHSWYYWNSTNPVIHVETPNYVDPVREGYRLVEEELTAPRVMKSSPARQQSLRLLYQFLTPAQWNQLKQAGYFDVKGGTSQQMYRIHWKYRDSMVANVVRLKPGIPYAANDNWKKEHVDLLLCAHADRSYAIGDQLLAQKLMIEFEEEKFMKIANQHPLEYSKLPPSRRLLKAA